MALRINNIGSGRWSNNTLKSNYTDYKISKSGSVHPKCIRRCEWFSLVMLLIVVM